MPMPRSRARHRRGREDARRQGDSPDRQGSAATSSSSPATKSSPSPPTPRSTLTDALRAVKVEYEVLPFLVKEEDALQERQEDGAAGRPGKDAITCGRPSTAKTDDFDDGPEGRGRGRQKATYGVPTICHQCLESHGLVAEWDDDGGLTVWASTQAVTGTAEAAGRVLLGPEDRPAGQQGQVHHALHGRRLRQQVRAGHPGHRLPPSWPARPRRPSS